MWTAESKGLARGRGARRGRSRPWGPRPWQADAAASPRVGRHTESQGKRLLFGTLITLTDGPWPSAKAPGVPSPGAGPQRGGGASESYLDSLPTSVPTTSTTQLCLRSRLPP